MKPTCIPSTLTVLALASMSTHAAVNYIDYNAGAGTWAVDPAYSTAAAGTYYRALEPAKSPGMPIGSYAARAGGGIDLIYLAGDGSGGDPYRAATYNVTPLVPGTQYSGIAMDRSGFVPGGFLRCDHPGAFHLRLAHAGRTWCLCKSPAQRQGLKREFSRK